MSFSPTPRQIVLEEVFDEASLPTDEEIHDYALRIGINPDTESHLLYLARDGLMQALPAAWKPCYDEDRREIYYFNFKLGKAQWEHPLDEVYRSLVKKTRTDNNTSTPDQLDDDSRTSIKEDLKSFEEASLVLPSSEMYPKPRVLEPLGKSPLPKKLSPVAAGPETEVRKRPNSSDIRNRRNIGPMEFRHLSKHDIITPKAPQPRITFLTDSKDEGYGTEFSVSSLEPVAGKRELTLTGGGAVFLKNKTRTPVEEAPGDPLAPPRSILRDQKLMKEAAPQSTGVESAVSRKEELEDERKSVRFNLEKELKINFELPEGTSSESETVISGSARAKQDTIEESRQIEIDFDDLEMQFQKIQVPKKTDAKKAKTSHLMVQEFRELFEPRSRDRSPGSNGPEDRPPHSPHPPHTADNLIDLSEIDTASSGESQRGKKLKDDIFDANFGNLVDFAMKKKMFESGPTKPDAELENAKNGVEKAKKDKLEELEKEYGVWMSNAERTYEEKREAETKRLTEQWEKRKEGLTRELEGKMEELKEVLREKEEETRTRLEREQLERLKALKEKLQGREATELDSIRQSLDRGLEERKQQLLQEHRAQLDKIEGELHNTLSDQRSQKLKELEVARENEAAIEAMRLEMKENYQKQKTNLMKEHESLLENLRAEQGAAAERLRAETKGQEEKLARERRGEGDARVFEKIRCEKRLLEDKYKTLKEKYIRLKTDVKISLERRGRRREGGATTGSETEKSVSCKTNTHGTHGAQLGREEARRGDGSVDRKLQKAKKQMTNLDNVNQNVSLTTTDEEKTDRHSAGSPKNWSSQLSPIELNEKDQARKQKKNKVPEDGSSQVEDTSCDEIKADTRKRRQLFSKLKAASTSRLNVNNKASEKSDGLVSPVENLRRQLKKLEELEDQFPMSTHTDTYMRYPFTETSPQWNSSELEFFKHRIHVERDSVRRAKEFLKAQKKCFETRQRELKQTLGDNGGRSRRAVDQVYQEEKELTDMEVSVHRTRALLGEKIIRLRHLEQSLRRLAKPEDWPSHEGGKEGSLSEGSSQSDSSGPSAPHYHRSGNQPSADTGRRHVENHVQDSTEMMVSLENLNSEIREIWEVLKQQHKAVPPPPLVYSDMAWPETVVTSLQHSKHRPSAQQYMTQVTAGSNLGHVTTVVDSSLVDRTRSLRDWLKAARSSTAASDVTSANQVTL